MPIPQEALDAVGHNNVKTIGEALAFLQTQSLQDLLASRNRLDRISEAVIARATQSIIEPDPLEAVATQKILSGNDLAQQVAQLTASVAAMQQTVKAAQTTPPVTP